MNWRVIWRKRTAERLSVYQFLARERGRDPLALPRAIEEIDRLLSIDPLTVGESRHGNERVLIVRPLSVFYEAFEDEMVVLIYAAVHYPSMRA
jgi:hypothetical protein